MSLPSLLRPLIRRAILDLLADIGGEQTDDVIARLLIELGHRVARREVAEELKWLADCQLVTIQQLGPFVVGEIAPDGLDVAAGHLRVEGVDKHKTGR